MPGAKRRTQACLVAVLGVLAGLSIAGPVGHDPEALGQKLFFDKRLSGDGMISCASCHRPELAFADGLPAAKGIRGQLGVRNTPSLLTVAEYSDFFWDGRRQSLEAQVLDPFTNAREHGLNGIDALLAKIKSLPDYESPIRKAFGHPEANGRDVAAALAAYVRSLAKRPSRFDEFWNESRQGALTASERRGLEVFRGVAQCANCHLLQGSNPSLTDGQFHTVNAGSSTSAAKMAEAAQRSVGLQGKDLDALISSDASIAALGRFNVTKRPGDIGEFRTPSLINVANTPPYMHDGRIASLTEAVDLEIYYRSVQQGRPIVLTAAERSDLLAFLGALSVDADGNH